MEHLFGQRETVKSSAAMAARVAADAKRAFSSRADDMMIDQCVRQAVDELTLTPLRVTSFVPVLAMRRVRELLETRSVAMMDVTAEA